MTPTMKETRVRSVRYALALQHWGPEDTRTIQRKQDWQRAAVQNALEKVADHLEGLTESDLDHLVTVLQSSGTVKLDLIGGGSND
ncbi:hypothetical protein MRI28_11005 [Nocardiopsis dassonvillei]|uniref:hypothetical protein n=1 Tax=Nocardiopsis dassonvillei TaxID=2014 RepID=UPI00200D9726|nr:hypothetical protein [Nocardiopsis dassonvillei]MCK9870161.1 hypothetical protein [Nocardiopsis dassonvillei]